MIRLNETFQVKALYPCENILKLESTYEHDLAWRQTVVGCMVLNFLKNMFHFNITYTMEDYSNLTGNQQWEALYPHNNDSVDIYVKPMQLTVDTLNNAYPIQVVNMWRFGFILRRQRTIVFRAFYTQPFTSSVWICIYLTIFFGSIMFYILSCWDNRLFGVECSFPRELLFAFSAYCQHVLPSRAISNSRRIAYLSFIICAFVVHNYYTSNLLSHLVSDKDDVVDLQTIVKEDYQVILMKDMNLNTDRKHDQSMDKNLSIVWDKVKKLKMLDLRSAVEAVVETKSALMTDYITLYPILKRYYGADVICQLVEVELYSNLMNYFFTSQKFPYKEEFKIGTLRAKEAGLFRRMVAVDKYKPTICELKTRTVQTEQTLTPMTMLILSYFLALIALVLERLYYNRTRVWPYVN